MPPKKKTSISTSSISTRASKRKSTRITSVTESVADLSAKTALCDGVPNAFVSENRTTDSDKNLVNSKAFFSDWLNVDEKSDVNNIKSLRSKHMNVSNFKSIIDKLKNTKIEPPVHVYSIKPEGRGISAVDVSQDISHVAYSLLHSHEVFLCARNSLSGDIARNDLRATWSNFLSARNKFGEAEKSEKSKIECLSSPQHYFIKHNDDVSGLCFTLDDSILMSCSLDGYAKAISTTTYRVLEHYSSYGPITDIHVNSRVTEFATTNALSCAPFHVAYLYKFERKNPVQSFSGHESPLKCIRFHPNGLYFATAASDKSIKLWSALQSKEVRCFKDEGMDNPKQLTFSPDGKYIASAYDGYVKIWDLAAGRKLKCLNTSNSGGKQVGISNFSVCYNFDGSMLAAGGSDKQIHFWSITSGESSEISPEYDFLKSKCVDKTILSIKYVSSFFSCVTG